MKMITFSLILMLVSGITMRIEGSQTKTSQEVTLRPNQQKVLRAANLTITFVSVVEDSRCPAGVNCVWAGNGRVKIKVSGKNKQTQVFELNTNLSPQSITFQGREIKLLKLEPAANKDTSIKSKDYLATFII